MCDREEFCCLLPETSIEEATIFSRKYGEENLRFSAKLLNERARRIKYLFKRGLYDKKDINC
jgi:hypothetical protein